MLKVERSEEFFFCFMSGLAEIVNCNLYYCYSLNENFLAQYNKQSMHCKSYNVLLTKICVIIVA